MTILFSRKRAVAGRMAFIVLCCWLCPHLSDYAWAADGVSRPLKNQTCAASADNSHVPDRSAHDAPNNTVAYGMNFNWWQVDTSRVLLCAAGMRGATVRDDAFLKRYAEPAVRASVQKELKQMRESGFTDLRTMVFSSPEVIREYFQIDQDKKQAGDNLRQYVSDVGYAGFRHLEIEFGTSAAGRSCGWGRCLSPDTMDRTIAFIISVRRALADPSPVELSFDLLNEACIWPQRPMRSNLQEYLRRLVSAYVAAFPRDKSTISCGARHFQDGRASIDAIYASARRAGPDYYEVHLYSDPNPRLEPLPETIAQVTHALSNSHAPLIVGETGYGDIDSLRELESGLREAGGGLRAIYFWPKKTPGLTCDADVGPPYSLHDAKSSK